jgi:cell division protein FtsW
MRRLMYNGDMAKRLFWLTIVFLVFGLIVLSSASLVQSQNKYGTSSYYLMHQLLWGVLPGVALMWVLWRVPYHHWRKLAFPLLFTALALLILVFVPSIGLRLKGATSWITLVGVTFQPAEILKLALVVYLAAWLGEGGQRLQNWQLGLLPFSIVMGFVGLLLLLQPDLGTLGVVLVMAGGIYLIAGAPWKQVLAIGGVTAVVIVGMASFSPERWSRITTVFNPAADTRGAGWQLNQALIAIGAGGIWGVGLNQSTQKFGFLPEPMGDSIFAIIVEELGFVGGIATVALFTLMAFTLVRIAHHAPDAFGSLLVSGMFLWIMTQAVVNMAAITGIGPLTGIPLPFISYGGTSMVSMLAGIGIVLNVAERS